VLRADIDGHVELDIHVQVGTFTVTFKFDIFVFNTFAFDMFVFDMFVIV